MEELLNPNLYQKLSYLFTKINWPASFLDATATGYMNEVSIELRKMCEKPTEAGQQLLVADLEALLADARAGEFGDFTNRKYDAPKMSLGQILHELRENVINGKYDAI